MIVNFTFNNFRSIKNKVTLSFEASNSEDLEDYFIVEPKEGIRLLKLGLIYGQNASGKTSVLLALEFIRDLVLEPRRKKTDSLKFAPFLFDEKSATANSSFSLEFFHEEVRYLFEIELNGRAISNERLYFYAPKRALVYERTTDLEKQLTKIEFGSKLKVSKEHKAILEANTLWNNSVLGGYLKTNFESYELQQVIGWFERTLYPLITPKSNLLSFVSDRLDKEEILKDNVIAFLKKADFRISDIVIEYQENKVDMETLIFLSKRLSIPEEDIAEVKQSGKIKGKNIYFEHETKKRGGSSKKLLHYFDESSGTQRYYQLSGLLDLMIRNEVVISIDELESSLHPELFKHFLLTFLVNVKNSQLIATTHHREFLKERDIFRNDVIWFTEKQEDGSTDLFSLDDFDSSIVRNTSSVYNAYKIGKLGATPNLQDHFIDNE